MRVLTCQRYPCSDWIWYSHYGCFRNYIEILWVCYLSAINPGPTFTGWSSSKMLMGSSIWYLLGTWGSVATLAASHEEFLLMWHVTHRSLCVRCVYPIVHSIVELLVGEIPCLHASLLAMGAHKKKPCWIYIRTLSLWTVRCKTGSQLTLGCFIWTSVWGITGTPFILE